MYATGYGVPRSYGEAVRWFQKFTLAKPHHTEGEVMKRDKGLERFILLAVEATKNTRGIIGYDEFSNDGRYSNADIHYHLNKMAQDDLIVVDYLKHGAVLRVRALTRKGHEALDAARKGSLLNQVKAKVLETAGRLGFDALKGLGFDALKTYWP